MKNQVKDNRRRRAREEFHSEKLSATTMLSFFKTWKLERLSGTYQRMGTWYREQMALKWCKSIEKENKRRK